MRAAAAGRPDGRHVPGVPESSARGLLDGKPLPMFDSRMWWQGQSRGAENKRRRLADEATMKRSTLIGVAVVGLILIVLAVGITLRPHSNAGSGPAPLVGHEAPNFSLENTGGRVVSLSTFRGGAVLLNFWATWCIPCRTEMPLINRAFQAHHKSLQVLAVDLQEPASDVD